MLEQSIADLFAKAGLTRWPLLACSIVGMAIIFERIYFFGRIRFNYVHFSHCLFKMLRDDQLMEAIHWCNDHKNPAAQIAGTYLSNLKHKRRDSILTREGSFALERVEARLRGLATITHVAPLLGLLGTVAGLVVAFHQIEQLTGAVQAKDLAGGIWEALLSTVFGLIIAIPCMIAYHGFESCSDRIARRMQLIVDELNAFYGNHSFKLLETDVTSSTDDEHFHAAE